MAYDCPNAEGFAVYWVDSGEVGWAQGGCGGGVSAAAICDERGKAIDDAHANPTMLTCPRNRIRFWAKFQIDNPEFVFIFLFLSFIFFLFFFLIPFLKKWFILEKKMNFFA